MPIFDMDIQLQQQTKTKKPSMYNVYLYNDDVTPFEFVEQILQQIFKKEGSAVMRITQEAHNNGKALVGTYIRDVAVSRCNISQKIEIDSGFPLKVQPEEAE